eukprot:Awhi_evm1s13380
MQSFIKLLTLVGVATASSGNYECFSVDRNTDNYWCQENCLDFHRKFINDPACFNDIAMRSVHTVCECVL